MSALWVRDRSRGDLFHLIRPRMVPFLSVYCQAIIQRLSLQFDYDPPNRERCGECQERASGEYR